VLEGGDGADIFFYAANYITEEGGGNDTILDFHKGEDKIQISQLGTTAVEENIVNRGIIASDPTGAVVIDLDPDVAGDHLVTVIGLSPGKALDLNDFF
jgi:Ca2+-binding RTX toxin-like protein